MHQLGNLLGAIGVAPLVLANAFATFANDGRYCDADRHRGSDRRGGTEAAGPDQRPAATPIKPEVARGVNSVLQDVLKKGSGVYIKPKVQSRFPVAAKTGTSNTNGATWVVGYTSGLATASFFGDALEGQKRPGQNITVNGKFYKTIDGYMLAGPQWANYMLEVAGLYPAAAFPAPPESMTRTPSASRGRPRRPARRASPVLMVRCVADTGPKCSGSKCRTLCQRGPEPLSSCHGRRGQFPARGIAPPRASGS